MRAMLACSALIAGLLFVFAGAQADDVKTDAKEVTLKGTITCAKCDLGQTKACATVIVTKAGDKETIFFFDTASNKKYHGKVCTAPAEGSVTGTVSEKDGKKVIHPSSVDFK